MLAMPNRLNGRVAGDEAKTAASSPASSLRMAAGLKSGPHITITLGEASIMPWCRTVKSSSE